jgi:murein DD-endopeptidase MepM/ murein hydrolase activator NlpD
MLPHPGTWFRALVFAGLAASGVVAAFATISTQPEVPPTQVPLVEALAIEPTPIEGPASYIREEQFQRGDTLASFLVRLGIAQEQVSRLKGVRALQQLRPGVQVGAEVSADGAPLWITFLAERDKLVRILPEGEGYRTAEERAAFETRIVMKSAVVRSSLFAASDAAGIPDSIAIQLADVFAGDVDFYRDLRKEDRFTVVYEMHTLLGRPVRAGRLLSAEFVNQGKSFRAVHFGTGYYTPEGRNLRKAFLRSPLEFSRVSSGFGMRMHPIAQAWRQHTGIDYAAATGTRVRAVGDGIVDFAGVRGGYGKVVILRHHGQYATLYAHLSRFPPGMRTGARVAQGDTIGFVGQTGWATGPHLHYEFRIAGQPRNPLSVALPAALPIAPQQLEAFRAHAEPLVSRLDLLANGGVALLD